ncbi:MAG: hypothetical protein L6Q80_02320 [Dehalococcoidia bacterium]|nr:hypothetical protein [Dehalococcoidia bacterium]
MVAFWSWGVRNPALAMALLGLVSGVAGVVAWSISLMALALGLVVADSAHHLAGRARRRKNRRSLAFEADRAARALREQYRAKHGPGARDAA